MLGLSNKYLGYMRVTKNQRYKVHKIPKSKGKFRTVYEADKQLKVVQYLILEQELSQIPLPDYLYAFEKGKSVRDMAEVQTRKAFILSWDIKDFFGSIRQKLVQEVLEKYFSKEKAKILSELVCYRSFVPQGTVTAPKIANIITAHTFGPELLEYFNQHGGVLTIYADDITVGFDRLLTPSEVKNYTKIVVDTLYKYRFRVSHQKTKAMPWFRRQYVVGAVVNAKVNLAVENRDRLKAAVHGLKVRGVEAEAARTWR